MQKINIPKKRGGFRTIYVQGPYEKHNYRILGYELAEFYEKHAVSPEIAHGFVEGRSPVSNAQKHINKKFTLTIDLKNFFDTVTEEHLKKVGIPEKMAQQACYDGATRQGLSSSPAAANCAAILLDRLIVDTLKIRDGEFSDVIYTRYADDLTFSSDHIEKLLFLRVKVPELVKEAGFKVNPQKTRIQSAKYGRRIITGVAVDDKIYATKKQRKLLRSMKYNLKRFKDLLAFLIWTKHYLWFSILLEVNRKNFSKYLGLSEWCKLKSPTKSMGGKCLVTSVMHKTNEAFELKL